MVWVLPRHLSLGWPAICTDIQLPCHLAAQLPGCLAAWLPGCLAAWQYSCLNL